MSDNFNPSEEQIEQFILQHGDDLGSVEPELMASFMAGDIEVEVDTDGDTADAKATDPDEGGDAAQEASQASDGDQDENVADADKDTGADAADQGTDDKSTGEEQPDILAKDGKNTIPYSALEEVRTELETLKDQNDELKKLLEARPELEEEAEAAAKADEEAGDTKASELFLEGLDDNLEEDYPGITDKLKATLAPLFEKLDKIDELAEDKAERDTRTEAEVAQDTYNEDVQKLNPQYVTAINDDKEEFWKWFDEQPSYVRAAESSGVPEQFADVVKSFYEQRSDPSEAEEKREPKVDPADVKTSVDKAKADAEKKSGVTSLSSLPGGKNPEHDENEAILKMSPMELAEKLEGKTEAEVEAYMQRVL